LKQLKSTFVQHQVTPNLMPYQQKLLLNLCHPKDFIILLSNKNLGPCILE
jgi:hypothetical protein